MFNCIFTFAKNVLGCGYAEALSKSLFEQNFQKGRKVKSIQHGKTKPHLNMQTFATSEERRLDYQS